MGKARASSAGAAPSCKSSWSGKVLPSLLFPPWSSLSCAASWQGCGAALSEPQAVCTCPDTHTHAGRWEKLSHHPCRRRCEDTWHASFCFLSMTCATKHISCRWEGILSAFSLFAEADFHKRINYSITGSIFALLISLPLPFLFCTPLALFFSHTFSYCLL